MSTPSIPSRFVPPAHDRVRAVPAFDDNYLWLIVDAGARSAAVVDPGDPQAIEQALAAAGLTLTAILLTHHHGDHIGGVAALSAHWRCPVFGPADERIGGLTKTLADGERVQLAGLDLELQVISVPGHTRSHIAYFGHVGTDPRAVLFCGDTLFAAGCGRMFEGTPAQMHASLSRLASLPEDTLVYCAHEYTLANLRFALAVEPGSSVLAARDAEARSLRERGVATVPSTIGAEKQTNPFLRVSEPTILASLDAHGDGRPADGAARFGALRRWKDQF